MAHSLETNFGEEKQIKQEEDLVVLGNYASTFIAFPQAVRCAFELGIFDILAKDVKLSAKDISIKIGAKNPKSSIMLESLLRLLASHSMLNCSLSHEDQHGIVTPESLYSLAPISMCFVVNDVGACYGSLLNNNIKFLLESCGFKGAIMERGKPFNRVHDMNMFNKTKAPLTKIVMERILESYQGFEHTKKLVDVGGGDGTNLHLIISKYPYIEGVNFNLPHLIEHATSYPGVTYMGGDMFESVPKGDVIFLKEVLHNWNDEHCLKLLKNCFKAIPNDGKVIVVELILPVLPDTTIISKVNSQFDLLMITSHPEGKERTQNEFIELALESGFSGIKFINCISGKWVMEFFKEHIAT